MIGSDAPRLAVEDYRALLWLQSELARYAYKPGYTMVIRPGGPRDTLVVTMNVPDSRSPLPPADLHWSKRPLSPPLVELTFSATVPHGVAAERSPEMFAHWLASTLTDMEVHERREWLRRDGEILDDPHAREATDG